MAKYKYNGPVVRFGRCIANNWKGETTAESKAKAMSNLEYQFKKQANLNANVNVGLFNNNLTVVE